MSKRNPNWMKIEEAASRKRSGKVQVQPKTANTGKIALILSKQELVVQRLSAQWSGKTPKFSPIGPREFVPFFDEDVTLDSIKSACLQHFKRIDDSVLNCSCDVLASVYGPTCKNIDHIPNLALMHVKFVPKEKNSSTMERSSILTPSYNMPTTSSKLPPFSVRLQPKSKAPKFMHSLSLSTMMKVGKVVNESLETMDIKVNEFHLDSMMWNELNESIKLSVNKEKFGAGTFRDVYKVSSSHANFKGEWVIKRYNTETIKRIMEEYNQTLEEHTKKVVQMTNLAGYFAQKLRQTNKEAPQFQYVEIYLGKIIANSEFVTIERFIKGNFEKFLNNDGICGERECELSLKAECLAHYSFHKSNEALLLTDIQGCGETLTDPEIASSNFVEDQKILFCIGNFCRKAIKSFALTHRCNAYCRIAGLKPLDENKFQEYDDTVEFPVFESDAPLAKEGGKSLFPSKQ